MFDSLTKRPIAVSTDGDSGPYIIVQEVQLQDVTTVLDRADIGYAMDVHAIRADGIVSARIIRLHESEASSAQAVLDEAAVTVFIHLVDGGLQEYFLPQSVVDRVDALRADGYKDTELIHELFSDDLGAPPCHCA